MKPSETLEMIIRYAEADHGRRIPKLWPKDVEALRGAVAVAEAVEAMPDFHHVCRIKGASFYVWDSLQKEERGAGATVLEALRATNLGKDGSK